MSEVPGGPLQTSVSETIVMLLISLPYSCVLGGINEEKNQLQTCLKSPYFHRDYDAK